MTIGSWQHMDDNSTSEIKHDNYLSILRKHWGYDSFRGIQRDIIESIGAGRDTLGLMPTGGGKSVTFQVPAMAMEGTCLVVTPLISLMKDQVDNLRHRGIKAYAIYSGMPHYQIVTTLENCIFSKAKFLYVSPERLSSQLFLAKLRQIDVSFITVDEAHCISQWGYDFRPAYLEIAKIRDFMAEHHNGKMPPVLALTATATPAVVGDIQRRLNFKQENVFRMSFVRENLVYVVRKAEDKNAELIHILKAMNSCAIVYVRSRRLTKEIADLINNKLPSDNEECPTATFYHAGLNAEDKELRQEAWRTGKIRVMVATNAFGMGIDKADVRVVIHTDPPSSIEAYFQEAGRAGRDGERAYAVMLYNKSDNTRLLKHIDEAFPPKEYIRKVYDHLAYYYEIGIGSGEGHTFELSMERFCKAYQHFPTRVNAALTLLSQCGYIDYEPEPDLATRVKFLVSRDELNNPSISSPKENKVITTLLRYYGGMFSDFVFIDEDKMAEKTEMSRVDFYLVMRGLHQRGIVNYIPRKTVPLITYTKERIDGCNLVIPEEVYEQRRDRLKQRIEAMLNYLQNSEVCRSQQLVAYFGEENAHHCKRCDVCLNHGYNKKEQKQQEKEASKEIMELLADRKQHHISELHQLNSDSLHIKTALRELMSEDYLQMDGSFIQRIR